MRDIKIIEQRIAELNKKKKALVIKQAEMLFNKLYDLLGDKFSPELVLAIVSDSWKNSDNKQKEYWQSLAASFRPKRNNSSEQKNQKDKPTPISATAEKK